MNALLVVFFAGGVLASAQDPAFPGDVGEIVKGMEARFSEIEQPVVNANAVMGKAIEHAHDELRDTVVDQELKDDLEEAAYQIMKARVAKLKYLGGCPREFRGCPKNWVATDTDSCMPPVEYDGLCGPVPFPSLSGHMKESMTFACRAM